MGRAAVFIDGGYLDYTLKDEFGMPRIDYGKLSSELSQGFDLLRTYYYHCLPYQSANPTPEEADRFAKRQAFYDRLERLPRYTVRLGELAYRGNDSGGKPIYEQKRVDILLGVDLALLSAKRLITDAILVAGDSDFMPALQCAKDEGVVIHLVHGTFHRPHRDVWDAADERVSLAKDLIDRILRDDSP